MYDPEQHHRRSIRIRQVSYAESGGYFVTVCSHRHECLFGEVVDGEMRLNGFGEIVREEWERTAEVRANVELDAFVVMPNHMHRIIWILPEDGSGDVQQDIVGATRWVALHPGIDKGEGMTVGQSRKADQNRMSGQNGMADQNRATHRVAPTAGLGRETIGAIIGQFKPAVTRRINVLRETPGAPVWQRNYWEHIIRNGADLERIRRYIAENPGRWGEDRYFGG